MTTTHKVKVLDWGGGNICDKKNDVIWDNKHKLSIHWPIFSDRFLDGKKFKRKYLDKFYFNYHEDDLIKPIKFDYIDINDLVTKNNVWDFCSKIIVYYEVDD